MNSGFLIQSAASLAAIGLIVALAAWARIARPAPPLDEAAARRLFAEDFPDRAIEAVWLAVDGAGALARSGASALVLVRAGDGYAAREIPWSKAAGASLSEGRLVLQLGDAAAPRARLKLAAWPPRDMAA